MLAFRLSAWSSKVFDDVAMMVARIWLIVAMDRRFLFVDSGPFLGACPFHTCLG